MKAYTIKTTRDSNNNWQSKISNGICVSHYDSNGVTVAEIGRRFSVKPPLPPLIDEGGKKYLKENIGIGLASTFSKREMAITESCLKESKKMLLWTLGGEKASRIFIPKIPRVRLIYVDEKSFLGILAPGEEVLAKIRTNYGRIEIIRVFYCNRANKLIVGKNGSFLEGRNRKQENYIPRNRK